MHTRTAFHWVILAASLSACIACEPPHGERLNPGQRSADYVATAGSETDHLHLVVTRGSLELGGYLEISTKGQDGKVESRRVPITGTVSTDGVPSTFVVPSARIGVPDLELGIFFDNQLNIDLVGDNRLSFPRKMYLVKRQTP